MSPAANVEHIPVSDAAHAIGVGTMGAVKGPGKVKFSQRRGNQECGRSDSATDTGDKKPLGISDGHEFSTIW